VDRGGQGGKPDAAVEGRHPLADEVPGRGAEDLDADGLLLLVEQQLDLPLLLPLGEAAVVVAEVLRPQGILDAGLPGGLFVHADGGQLGVRVGAPGNVGVVRLSREPEDGVGDDDSPLVARGVRERVGARHVARPVDVAVSRRPEPAVEPEAPAVELDADRLEAEPFQVGLPPQGDEDGLGPQALRLLARPDHDLPLVAEVADLQDRGAEAEPDSLRFHDLHDRLGHVPVLAGEDLRGRIDDVDVRPQAAEGLSHLDADGACAEDDHGPGKPVEIEDLTVGEDGRPVEPGDGGGCCRRSRGDHPVLRRMDLPVEAYGVLVDEARLPECNPRAQRAEPFLGVVPLDRGDDRADPPGDVPEIDGGQVNGGKPVPGRMAHEVADVGRPDEGLARDAPVMEAVAAERVLLFDQQGLCAEARRPGRHGQAARPSADHADVEIIPGHLIPPCSVSPRS